MVLIAQVVSPIVHYMPEVDKGVDKCRELTGIGLLACVEGANSSTGLWHYKLGWLLSALSLIHVFYRK